MGQIAGKLYERGIHRPGLHGSHPKKYLLTDNGLMGSPLDAVIPAVHIMPVSTKAANQTGDCPL